MANASTTQKKKVVLLGNFFWYRIGQVHNDKPKEYFILMIIIEYRLIRMPCLKSTIFIPFK